jgi:hypothetical protein
MTTDAAPWDALQIVEGGRSHDVFLV